MSKADEILNNITKWADKEEPIRGLVLEGSRGTGQATDELADFDVNVFCTESESYIKDDAWMSNIAKVWVYEKEKGTFEGVVHPNRLVIFEDGIKVDFLFWDVKQIEQLAKSDYYEKGYKVLLDKDGKLKNLKEPTFKPTPPVKPTEEEFVYLIRVYWFEEYHVAKYLKREDLWLVKFRDWSIKYYLLKMMEWYMLAKNNWEHDVKWDGKHIKKWLEPEVYLRLFNIYAHFDSEDSWEKLIANNNLFRDIAKETAILLGYSYPEDVDKYFTDFTLSLKPNT